MLSGQTVVVIGGSSRIGLETARLARREGAQVIPSARDPDRLRRAGEGLGARVAAFDATDFGRLRRFFAEHLMTNTAVTGGTFDIDGGQQLVEG